MPDGALVAKRDAPVGGQAVLEGVMMRGISTWAVAVRTPEGQIGIESEPLTPWAKRNRLWRLPIIRGVVALAESMKIGFRALAISANAQIEDDEDGEPEEIGGWMWGGSDERDAIYGFDGNDNIRGHGGADLIVGGHGADHLHGDEGGDTFRFESIADSQVKAPDTIFDLGGNDRVDLHKIDADVTTDGDQGFTLVANLNGHAGQAALAYNPELDRTSLMMDVDGDGLADSIIYMQGDQTGFAGYVF